MAELNLQEIAGGALQEKVNIAFQQVLQNMHAPNTQYKPKRKIMLDISFEQNEDRSECICNISVNTKLANARPLETRFYSDVDLDTGEVILGEYEKGIKGQMDFQDVGISQGTAVPPNVDAETGEILENPVVDFRKKLS